MAAVCLGSSQGTLFNSVKRGANLELALTVTNPGSTPSPSITLVLFQFESGPWPFGAVSCPDCSAISQVPLAIEWRSLASGETRTLAATIVTSGAPGSYIWFADLYAQPLDAVKTLLTTVGTGTGLFDWKDQTTITAP
ncbi:MAG: hypothetical protein ACRDF7_04215 [Candidatus Limnocylindrales bacterium]